MNHVLGNVLRTRFSQFVWAGFAVFLTLGTAPLALRAPSQEATREFKGTLESVRVMGPMIEGHTSYVIEFREMPRYQFIAPHLSEIDGLMLTQSEKKGASFYFSVSARQMEDNPDGSLTLLSLESSKNRYIRSSDAYSLLEKVHGFGIVVFWLSLAWTLWWVWRIRGWLQVERTAQEKQKKHSSIETDSLLLSVLQAPVRSQFLVSLLIGGWLWLLWPNPVLPGTASLSPDTRSILAVTLYVGIVWALSLLVYLTTWRNSEWTEQVLNAETVREKELEARPETEGSHDLQAVEALLKSAGGIDAVNHLGQTALHIASRVGKTEAIDLLLRHGAGVNRQDHEGSTPLILAATAGHVGAVMKLLEVGADQRLKDHQGRSALDVAMANEKEAIVILLKKGTQVAFPLHAAAAQGNLGEVDRLLQTGADFNSLNDQGMTPLLLAIKADAIGVVQKLIARGADVSTRGPDKKTALEKAQENNNQALITAIEQAVAVRKKQH